MSLAGAVASLALALGPSHGANGGGTGPGPTTTNPGSATSSVQPPLRTMVDDAVSEGMGQVVGTMSGLLGVRRDACGPEPLKADGLPWQCSFDDEFNGSTLDRRKWTVQKYFETGDPRAAQACYTPQDVAVAGGTLRLVVRRTPVPVYCPATHTRTDYTAGMVSTYHLFSQEFGRFQARMWVSPAKGPGLHEAFWLWPDDRVPSTAKWPVAGEIDTAELYSSRPGYAIPFLHYSADLTAGPRNGLNTATDCPARRGAWNTYTLTWSPTQLQIQVNGTTCLVNTSANPAFAKRYIIALTEGLGSRSDALHDPGVLPGTTAVDYVRVWR